MKKIFSSIIIVLITIVILQSQPIEQVGSIYKVSISPANPTIQDSIILPLLIVFDDLGGTKWSSTLNLYSDTIIYSGCYYCPCVSPATFPTPDTIKLGLLPAGIYHVIIIAKYPKTSQDTFCLNSNPAYNDTVDTFFVVSPVNAIETPTNTPFYAMVENFNTLQINTGTGGPLAITVYDALGRPVYRNKQFIIQSGNNIVELKMPVLSQGIYFYQIDAGHKERVLKYVRM